TALMGSARDLDAPETRLGTIVRAPTIREYRRTGTWADTLHFSQVFPSMGFCRARITGFLRNRFTTRCLRVAASGRPLGRTAHSRGGRACREAPGSPPGGLCPGGESRVG